jgi:uncharacterized protein with GYD domain
MGTYISLMKWTAEGVKTSGEWRKRVANARRIAKKNKGTMREVYVTLGRYDVVAILEAPSDEALARIILEAAKAGTVSTETLRAFPEADAYKILEGK